jgi:Ca-activated chloride channel family protein
MMGATRLKAGRVGLASVVVLCWAAQALWPGGEAESASSASRGRYLAGRGVIVPPEEVISDSYVAYMDYRYPEPREALGVTLYSGHRQVAMSGQEEIIQIGVQGKKTAFAELPPLNLAFVIDKSGSMAEADKLDWVKESFGILIDKLRDVDYLALVVFDDTARVVYPSTRLSSPDRRLRCRAAVQGIAAGGGSDLPAGLRAGCEQVLASYRPEYTNRVLFLTDGGGASAGILQLADSYRSRGVSVSTIGVGLNFDVNLMVELGRRGGGSSRFISGREEMRKVFGSELERMAVPIARDLRMTLELADGVELLDTWGYAHRLLDRGAAYSQPALHQGDYETILARVRIPAGKAPGSLELARFTVEYQDLAGQWLRSGPHGLTVERVARDLPLFGISDAMVLRSATILTFADRLRRIGELYYSCGGELGEAESLRDSLWRSGGGGGDYQALTSPAILRLEESVQTKMRRAMSAAVEMKKELENARLRLGSDEFGVELEIARKYIQILGAELKWQDRAVAAAAGDAELAPAVPGRVLKDHLDNLFQEIGLDLRSRAAGTVAVCGFAAPRGPCPALLDMLDEAAGAQIARLGSLRVVERSDVEAALAARALSWGDLLDTGQAVGVGRPLGASFLVTGAVIEMEGAVLIFARVINVSSGQVESVAQIVVRKDAEVRALLARTRPARAG